MNNGISDGVGKITYLDGVTYIGSFRNGAKNGKGIKTYPKARYSSSHDDCTLSLAKFFLTF